MASPNNSSNNNLIIFGSIVQDLVSYVQRFPKPGESIRGKLFQMYCGGKGANQAVMSAMLGTHVCMVGRVGEDIFGDANIEAIKSSGADTSLIQKSRSAATGTATIYVADDGENCIVVTLGSNIEMSAQRALEVEEHIRRASLIICQSEIDQHANLQAFKIAKKHNVTTFLNPAPGRPDLDKTILAYTDIICTNENEAEFITGLTLSTYEEFINAAKEMLKMGPRIAIVTCGPKGAIVAQKKGEELVVHAVQAPKVTAVDTTGAGDCFCGSIAHFFCKNPNGDVVEMVSKAVKIAAISVQRKGAQNSYPSREELVKFDIL